MVDPRSHGYDLGEGNIEIIIIIVRIMINIIDVTNNLRGAIIEEEPGRLCSVIAIEAEVGVAEAARADAEGIVEGQIATAHPTTGERGSGGISHVSLLAS